MSNPSLTLLKWKLMQQIERMILKHGGSIFGGYCRDKIIHDHYATEFYKAHTNNRDKYSDESFDTTTAMRTLVPQDIDCFMSSSRVEAFKESLGQIKLSYTQIWSGDANLYFSEAPENIRHEKLLVYYDVNAALKRSMGLYDVKVDIDLLHSENGDTLRPPFGNVDFTCNAVVLSPESEYRINTQISQYSPHPKHKLEVLNQMILEIIEKKTRIASCYVPRHRILRMIAKGWKIEGKSLELSKASAENLESDDTCFVCLGEIREKVFTSRFKCCKASLMHAHCAKRMIEQSKPEACPTCRSAVKVEAEDELLIGITY